MEEMPQEAGGGPSVAQEQKQDVPEAVKGGKGSKKTPAQLAALEKAFEKNHFLIEETKKELLETTGLTENQISTWFTRQRRKVRETQEMEKHTGVGIFDVDVSNLNASDLLKYEAIQQAIEEAKQSLDMPYRDDGPTLGIYFDDVPSGQMANSNVPRKDAWLYGVAEEARAELLAQRHQEELMKLEASIRKEHERLEREQMMADRRMARESERELLRLEMERRRQIERALRDQKREDEQRARLEARLRLAQQKEERRLEQLRQREMRQQAKLREKEEKKKEKERMKLMLKIEKGALRTRNNVVYVQKDDLEFEWDGLIQKYKSENNIPDNMTIQEGDSPPDGAPPLPVRPSFPPESVKLQEVCPDGVSQEAVGNLLSAWSCLKTFHSALALDIFSVDEVFRAIAVGSESKILADIHIGLIRLLQADAEESKAGGYFQTQKAEDHSDAAIFTGAYLLEEAWAWGFDVDSWREHLNYMTWPEICRQLCISAGLGRRRPKRKAQSKARAGTVGEDIVVSPETGKLELRLPPRLSEGSVKAACWFVLKDSGYEGLRVEEIVKRIQNMGFRDLRTSRTPEASVAGAMGRDVLFERIAPATFALQSHRVHHKELKLLGADDVTGKEEEEDYGVAHVKEEENEIKREDQNGELKGNTDTEADGSTKDHEEEEEEEEDEDEEEEEEGEDVDEEAQKLRDAHVGEMWLEHLLHNPYDSLTLDERISLLTSLCQLALNSATVRDTMERRLEHQQKVKKSKSEEDKAEINLMKLKKQLENASRLRQQAYEAKVHMERFKAAQEGRAFDIQNVPPTEKSELESQLEAKVAEAEATFASFAGQKDIDKDGLNKRSKERAENALREIEMNAVRWEHLGMDRRYNKYWKLTANDLGEDANKGRIYVENSSTGNIKFIGDEVSLENLLQSLYVHGERESMLRASLIGSKAEIVKHMPAGPWTIHESMPSSNAVNIADAKLAPAAERYLLMQNAHWSPSNSNLDADLKVAKIKEAMLAIHQALTLNTSQLADDTKSDEFKSKIISAKGLVELKELLGILEQSMNPKSFHSSFSAEPLLVRGAWISIGTEVATALPGSTVADVLLPSSGMFPGSNAENDAKADNNSPLAWLPDTIASLALRLSTFDASIKYDSRECGRDWMEGYRFTLRPFKQGSGNSKDYVRSMIVKENGRVKATLFPPFPYRLLFSPRSDFSFPLHQFKSDIAKGSDAMIASDPASKARLSMGPPTRGRRRGGPRRSGGRGRGRGRGRSGLNNLSQEKQEGYESDPNYGSDMDDAGMYGYTGNTHTTNTDMDVHEGETMNQDEQDVSSD